MALRNIDKYVLKRVNPFQGLVIDDDIWRDSHDYHRIHQQLHNTAVHGAGIVVGLGVSSNRPPDLSLTIYPGMAIDQEGNIIIVAKPQTYQLQSHDRGTVYIIIQFREVPTGPFQPPEGGQPTRILEAYRIQERTSLPSEAYLELARIDFDPGVKNITVAGNPYQPGVNQLDLRFRQQSAAQIKRNLTFWHLSLDQDKEIHRVGFANLAREISRNTDFQITIEPAYSLNDEIKCNLLYLTGKSTFDMDTGAKANLTSFIQYGGILIGEGCAENPQGARDFGIAFNHLARDLGHRLEKVNQGNPLLSRYYVFGTTPPGAAADNVILCSPRIIYSGSDYGCAWCGGRDTAPLSREVIRSAFEIGMNICLWGR
jgi:hypothetical protein